MLHVIRVISLSSTIHHWHHIVLNTYKAFVYIVVMGHLEVWTTNGGIEYRRT